MDHENTSVTDAAAEERVYPTISEMKQDPYLPDSIRNQLEYYGDYPLGNERAATAIKYHWDRFQEIKKEHYELFVIPLTSYCNAYLTS